MGHLQNETYFLVSAVHINLRQTSNLFRDCIKRYDRLHVLVYELLPKYNVLIGGYYLLPLVQMPIVFPKTNVDTKVTSLFYDKDLFLFRGYTKVLASAPGSTGQGQYDLHDDVLILPDRIPIVIKAS